MTAGLGNRILADHLGPDRELTHELVNWTKEQVGGAYGYELRVCIFFCIIQTIKFFYHKIYTENIKKILRFGIIPKS